VAGPQPVDFLGGQSDFNLFHLTAKKCLAFS